MAVSLVLLQAGCSSAPEPHSPASPAPPVKQASPETESSATAGSSPYQIGAADSVGNPGSPDALYRYRIKQIDPASDRFTFQDRELSFYFRPAPDAIHFQIENRQSRPVRIDWDRSKIYGPLGRTDRIAHASTRWIDRYGTQAPTQIMGLQRYGDYVLPLDYMLDPGASTDQIHRPLLPEDESAPQYDGHEFGVDLVIQVENQTRTYAFRFRVVSVLPR